MILPEAVRKLQLPKMVKIPQNFPDDHLEDTAAAVRKAAAPFVAEMNAGASVAVLAGSRGIRDIDLIVRTVVEVLLQAGLEPFIIPAMGSHGGGTSEGQEQILRDYGITAETMGVPINSSMETEIVGETSDGIEVHFSRPALEADFVVPIGRVKPHTDFSGRIESGLCKMLAIGGGKHNGCSRLHREGFPALEHTVPDSAEYSKTPNRSNRISFIHASSSSTSASVSPGNPAISDVRKTIPGICLNLRKSLSCVD